MHPIIQRFKDNDIKLLGPIIETAGKLNLFVQIHCSPMFGFSSVEGVLRLAFEYPDTKIILLHAAIQRFRDLYPISRALQYGFLKNLYIEVSGAIVAFQESPFWNEFKWVMHEIGAKNILFGSDFPVMSIIDSIKGVHMLEFSKDDEEFIFFRNMMKLL